MLVLGCDHRRDILGMVLVFLLSAVSAQQPGAGHSRLFPPSDLGLLDAPDRDLWQRPDLIMDSMGIADGSVVGRHRRRQRLVHDSPGAPRRSAGPRLRRRRAAGNDQRHLDVSAGRASTTSRPVLGTIDDPKLPPQSLDAA